MILAIDPSLRELGVAVVSFKGEILLAQQISQRTPDPSWVVRAQAMAEFVGQVVHSSAKHWGTMTVALEAPSNWGTQRGLDSKNAEDIQKLYHLTGALIALAAALPSVVAVYVVRPNQWKGQAPKHIMIARAHRELGTAGGHLPSDVAEAILLARHAYEHRVSAVRLSLPYELAAEGAVTRTGCTDNPLGPAGLLPQLQSPVFDIQTYRG